LGRIELPPQTRRLLKLIHAMVIEISEREHMKRGEVRFTRRDVRDYTRWSDNQLKVHCMRLAELEYLVVHGGSRGHLLRYELMYDGAAEGEPRLAGLIDLSELDNDECKLDLADSKLAPSCPQVGAKLGRANVLQSQAGQGGEDEAVGVGADVYTVQRLGVPSLARVV
jgi:hypothetical protein